MLTLFECARLLAEPALPVLHTKVRARLKSVVQPGMQVLDVGGRRSPYTVGLPIDVTIIDLPRESEVQASLGLGLNAQVLAKLRQRRSNVGRVVIEDMTRCTLPDASFDGAVCVEVLEHVPDDHAFLTQIARVLRPGGWLCLTTPNGDYIRNEPPSYNPDHLRHYRRQQLTEVLYHHFESVSVVYGVATGRHRIRGLRSFDFRKPLRLAQSMVANLINRWESRGVEQRAIRTAHLFAIATKARG